MEKSCSGELRGRLSPDIRPSRCEYLTTFRPRFKPLASVSKLPLACFFAPYPDIAQCLTTSLFVRRGAFQRSPAAINVMIQCHAQSSPVDLVLSRNAAVLGRKLPVAHGDSDINKRSGVYQGVSYLLIVSLFASENQHTQQSSQYCVSANGRICAPCLSTKYSRCSKSRP